MDLKHELAEHIRSAVLENNSKAYFREPLIGYSSPNDELFDRLPELVSYDHLHPRDILPEVKTVLSFYIPFSKLVVDSNRKSASVPEEWAFSYLTGNDLINKICDDLVDKLQARGIPAATFKATYGFDAVNLKAQWSHRSAAFIAGLGRFGLNRMLITDKGCAGRYGTLFIGQYLEPDPRSEDERCLYYKNGKCRYCVDHCPSGALTENGFDRSVCYSLLLKVVDMYADYGYCDVCGKCALGPCAYIDG